VTRFSHPTWPQQDHLNYNAGLIIEDITPSIQEASIIIADITPDNPNVFYEVGYAHGIKKPTILLSERDGPPFRLTCRHLGLCSTTTRSLRFSVTAQQD